MVGRAQLRYIFTVAVLAVWICLFCVHVHAAQPFELHLLDVGQGQCVLIEADGHYPSCNSVNQMNESNRMNTNLSRDELIAQGYQPCGNCHP